MSYYERTNVVHLDGSHIFHKPEDQRAERDVAEQISAIWKCELHSFGSLSPIDWYAVRYGRMVGVLELKARGHTAETYPTVFLNVRKWLALSLATIGLHVPAIFVVKFIDKTCWTPLAEINASRVVIGGCARQVKAVNDIEPVIEVPITILRRLDE